MASGRSDRKKSVATDYLEVDLSTGESIKVHRVPEALINDITLDEPRPKRPQIAMETKHGTQYRAAKEGDESYDEWVEATDEWKQRLDKLQEDVRLCLAMKSYNIPDPIVFPDEIQELIDDGLLKLPTGKFKKYQLKSMWLHAVPLAAYVDETEIFYATQKLSGIDDEAVDKMKENFRRGLLGQAAELVGAGTVEADSGEPEEDHEG